jgi:hypothetical protein
MYSVALPRRFLPTGEPQDEASANALVAGFVDSGLLNAQSFAFSYSPRATGGGTGPIVTPAVPTRETNAGREQGITNGRF